MSIRRKNYNLVTDSSKIIKVLNKMNIMRNIDGHLVELYLADLGRNYTVEEIKLMKKTLENEMIAKNGRQSVFMGLMSLLVALVAIFIGASINATSEESIKIGLTGIAFVLCISLYTLIIFYFFTNDNSLSKRSKLINVLNLYLEIKPEDQNK